MICRFRDLTLAERHIRVSQKILDHPVFFDLAGRVAYPVRKDYNMLYQEIYGFLESNGAGCREILSGGERFILARTHIAGKCRSIYILPAETDAGSFVEAEEKYLKRQEAKKMLSAGNEDADIITVAEDRWRSRSCIYGPRLLSHLGIFRPVYARNCEARRTDRKTAGLFLSENHSYGMSVCRYCYALYEKGNTMPSGAATFSNARKWIKDGQEIRSYEWVRYASSPGTRILGGMGKVLARFIEDIRPDDIMSYADMEWSDGKVYTKLGFIEDGAKAPVLFEISPEDWSRKAVRQRPSAPEAGNPGKLYFMNDGSRKYRLKLTGYRTTSRQDRR